MCASVLEAAYGARFPPEEMFRLQVTKRARNTNRIWTSGPRAAHVFSLPDKRIAEGIRRARSDTLHDVPTVALLADKALNATAGLLAGLCPAKRCENLRNTDPAVQRRMLEPAEVSQVRRAHFFDFGRIRSWGLDSRLRICRGSNGDNPVMMRVQCKRNERFVPWARPRPLTSPPPETPSFLVTANENTGCLDRPINRGATSCIWQEMEGCAML
jgi:hypothetical protein